MAFHGCNWQHIFWGSGAQNTNSVIFGDIWLLQLRSITVKHGIIPIVVRQRYHSMASSSNRIDNFCGAIYIKKLWRGAASWWSWWRSNVFNPKTDLCGSSQIWNPLEPTVVAASKVKMEKSPWQSGLGWANSKGILKNGNRNPYKSWHFWGENGS